MLLMIVKFRLGLEKINMKISKLKNGRSECEVKFGPTNLDYINKLCTRHSLTNQFQVKSRVPNKLSDS